ncbi:TPA: DUF6236 family protein [Raoultella ornithinolytica]
MKHGMILTNKMTITEDSIIGRGGFDPLALRLALLYMDEICVPQSSVIAIRLSEEIELLRKEGFLVVKNYPCQAGIHQGSSILKNAYEQCFDELNSNLAETWIMHDSLRINFIKENKVDKNGECMQLFNALPLPDEKFPLGDLLEFKLKRKDELKELLLTMEEMRIKIIQSENKEIEIKKGILEIERNLINISKVMKETRKGFYYSTFSIDIGSQDLLETFKSVYGEARGIGMEALSAFLLSAGISTLTAFNVKAGYRFKAGRPNSPYFYAADVKSKFRIN